MNKEPEETGNVGGDEKGGSNPPTPVRQAMEAGEAEERAAGEPRVIQDPESGEEWVVTVTGRSASGILPQRSVPVADLTFSRTHRPGEPKRQALIRDRDLEDIPDSELISLLHRAKPYRAPLRESERDSKRGRTRTRWGGRSQS